MRWGSRKEFNRAAKALRGLTVPGTEQTEANEWTDHTHLSADTIALHTGPTYRLIEHLEDMHETPRPAGENHLDLVQFHHQSHARHADEMAVRERTKKALAELQGEKEQIDRDAELAAVTAERDALLGEVTRLSTIVRDLAEMVMARHRRAVPDPYRHLSEYEREAMEREARNGTTPLPYGDQASTPHQTPEEPSQGI